MASLNVAEVCLGALISTVFSASSAMAQQSVGGQWTRSSPGALTIMTLRDDGTYERLSVVAFNGLEFASTIMGRYEIANGTITFHPISNIRTYKNGEKQDLGLNPEQKETFGIKPVSIYFRGQLLCFGLEHELCLSSQP